MKYNIIGDIHGRADKLEEPLTVQGSDNEKSLPIDDLTQILTQVANLVDKVKK